MNTDALHSWFPATVREYLTDPAIKTGVDALLKIDADDVPMDLPLDQITDYFTARGTAELTRHDFAATLSRLWTHIWGDRLAPEWELAPYKDLIREEHGITVELCWDNQTFSCFHRSRQFLLYTAFALEANRTTIALSLERSDGELLGTTLPPFTWLENDDWSGWLVLEQRHARPGPPDDIAPLLTASAQALAHVANVIRALG